MHQREAWRWATTDATSNFKDKGSQFDLDVKINSEGLIFVMVKCHIKSIWPHVGNGLSLLRKGSRVTKVVAGQQ